MRKFYLLLAFIFIVSPFMVQTSISDEGMYPLSELSKLNLRAKGFKISLKEIYNPKGTSLVDAIVNIGGCTGSFVSRDGLIITNHHCAFPAIQAASTIDHDYISNGFLAKRRTEEIHAKGNSVRITESYRDVSDEVLKGILEKMDVTDRIKKINKNIRDLITKTEKLYPGKRIEISEMFTGKTYVLFIYTFLKDVRLVYVPPAGIGNFGGENDNWIWPRHTGDFSFMRAYVAPDGSPADYSPDNVPYHPKKYLKVAPQGVNAEDFVFILGYPGRTFRHRTSHYLAFEQEIRLPYVADLYRWQIELMEKMGNADRAVAIKLASRIKGLANTEKNYRGKIQGMQRLHLALQKQKEEAVLQKFIESNPQRNGQYGSLLQDIGNVYDEMRTAAQRDMTLDYLKNSTLFNNAFIITEASRERQKIDSLRESAYTEKNLVRTKSMLQSSYNNFHEPVDKNIFKEMLLRASRLPDNQRIEGIDKILRGADTESSINQIVDTAFATSEIRDGKSVLEMLDKTLPDMEQSNDFFIGLARALYPEYQKLKETRTRREGTLSKLYAQYVDVKQEFVKRDFIPDANGTLRLTFGHIRGYSPTDATSYTPFTTLKGIIEKNTNEEPYQAPQKLIDLYHAKEYSQFRSKSLNDIPVAILYDMDTTGGNSGSPVMNAKGEIVGVNFDRAYEATINDYAWSGSYSRSIAVDIRYVLWVTQKIGGADFLLKEMGVPVSD